INMPDQVWSHFVVAVAAGQLGRLHEAEVAASALLKIAPELADESLPREVTQRWKWRDENVELAMDGGGKASGAAASTRGSAAVVSQAPAPSVSSVSGGMRAAATSIAVLPFSCRTSDEESTVLADGLTEDITSGLSRFSYLRVVADAARLKGEVSDARAASAQLGARYLLEGSIRKAGATVRV